MHTYGEFNEELYDEMYGVSDFKGFFKVFIPGVILLGLLFGGTFAYNKFKPVDYVAMKSPTVEIMISGTDDKGQHYEGHGSGVIVSPNFILTVYHVASEARDGPAEILFSDGFKGKAVMIWSDPTRDVAIMALTEATDIKPAVLSDSKATIGQDAWSVGYPMDLPLSVQHGEVVSDELKAVRLREEVDPATSTIYTNMTMGPGDSGGPVFNRDGEVIGLNDFIAQGIGSFSGIVAMQAILKDVRNVTGI